MAKNIAGNNSLEKANINCRYEIGQTLYLESPEQKEIREFEVAEIKLNEISGSFQKMYGVVPKEPESLKNTPDHSMMYLSESDIEKYLTKNTELLNEMRGQLAASMYTDGKRYATVELDNGRHISINEMKENQGDFTDCIKVSLYAGSEEIQKGLFRETGHVIEQYHGPDNVNFLYTALKNILEINEQMKIPNRVNQNRQQDNKDNFKNAFSYVVNKEPESSNMIITNEAGESLKLNIMEFWEIVKAGDRRDIRNEIDEILYESDYIDGIPVYLLQKNENALNMVTEKVRELRMELENHDQIYDVFHQLKPELQNMLYKELINVIDTYTNLEETDLAISGADLRSSSAAKERIIEYIFQHNLEPGDSLLEYIQEAIYECQDELKAILAKTRTESLEEKIKGTSNRTEKSTENPCTKPLEKPLER